MYHFIGSANIHNDTTIIENEITVKSCLCSKNQYDKNWKFDKKFIKGNSGHYTPGQPILHVIQFSIYDQCDGKSGGNWKKTTPYWCYSDALDYVSPVQLSNTGQDWFVVKYHSAICCH